MKRLKLVLNLVPIGIILFGCNVNQMKNEEVDELLLSEIDFVTERTIYKGKSYALSYSINEDSTLNFRDSQSEENYEFLISSINDKPTASIFISTEDSTVYLFDDNEQYEQFVQELNGVKEAQHTINDAALNVKYVPRKDIATKLNSFSRSDSGFVEDNFIYQKDIFKDYTFDGLIGSVKQIDSNIENVDNSGRKVWNQSGASIMLYEDINYRGESYEVLSSSGVDNFKEATYYTINVSTFNDIASSFIFANGTTRRMQVTFYEHPDASGSSFGIQLSRRSGNSINRYRNKDLTNAKLKPGCWFFCKKWNDRISSFKVIWWRTSLVVEKPTFVDVINAEAIIDSPIEYEFLSNDIAYLTLKKTATNNYWNSGASSMNGSGGYGVEYQIDSKNTDVMFGLSPANDGGASWNTIKYNVYVSKFRGNVVQIWQNGTYKFSYPYSYNVDDVITVINHGDFVGFYINNYFIGSLTHNGAILYLDNSIYNPNAVIRKINR